MMERDEGRSWPLPMPLRRVVTRKPPAPAAKARSHRGSIVDCAVYVDGARQPGRPDYAEALAAARHAENAFAWLGLHEPTKAELEDVARVFGLHELAVEDALTPTHRAKIERYGDIVFFILRTTRYVDH